MNTHLCNDLGADSLDKYELLFNIEDKFNIKLNSKEINSVLQQIDKKPTVAEIVKAIETHKAKKQIIKTAIAVFIFHLRIPKHANQI